MSDKTLIVMMFIGAVSGFVAGYIAGRENQ